MSSVLPYLSWARTLETAISPWRQSTDSPYYMISSPIRVELQPGQIRTVRTGIVFYLPDHIFARVSSFAKLCLEKTSGDDWGSEYNPLRVTTDIFMKSEFQRELLIEITNLGEEEYVINPGSTIAQLEFRIALTPTLIRAGDEIGRAPSSRPPTPIDSESRRGNDD